MRNIIAVNLIISVLLLETWPLAASAQMSSTSTIDYVDSRTIVYLSESPNFDSGGLSDLETNDAGQTEKQENESADPVEENGLSGGLSVLKGDAENAGNLLAVEYVEQEAATSSEELLDGEKTNEANVANNATSTIEINNFIPIESIDDETGEKADNWGLVNATTTEAGEVLEPAQIPVVLAHWITADGAGDVLNEVVPSGEYGGSSQYRLCAAVKDVDGSASVYGQVFYPRLEGFEPGDSRGRVGCGQRTAPVCEMQKIDNGAGFELFCNSLKNSTGGIPFFAGESNFESVCGQESFADTGAGIYCCNQSLAYDDIAGTYESVIMAGSEEVGYGTALAGNFEYLPLTLVEANFADLNYGLVDEQVLEEAKQYRDGAGAPGQPMVVNVGNTGARIKVWQDDMGMGMTEGHFNISYGIRWEGFSEWQEYDPFEWELIAGTLSPGRKRILEFSTMVTDYPDQYLSVNYGGQMKIEAEAVQNQLCVTYMIKDPIPRQLEDIDDFSQIPPVLETGDKSATVTEPVSADNVAKP